MTQDEILSGGYNGIGVILVISFWERNMKKINVLALNLLCCGLSMNRAANAGNMSAPVPLSFSAPLRSAAGIIASQMMTFNAQNAPSAFIVKAPVAFLGLGALGLQRQVLPAQIVPLLEAGTPVTVRQNRLVDLDTETGGMIASVPPFISKGVKTRLNSLQDLIDWGKRFGLGAPSK